MPLVTYHVRVLLLAALLHSALFLWVHVKVNAGPQKGPRSQSQVMFDDIQKIQTSPGTQDMTDVTNVQDEPEQLTIGEGTTVGHCHSLTYSGRVQVDNYFHSSDIDRDSDNEETSPSVLLFPGEADVELAGDKKPVVRNTCLQIHTSSTLESPAEEHLSDEVRPFSLDQSFDYDRVALTSKLSEQEMNFLRLREPGKEEETESGRPEEGFSELPLCPSPALV